MIVRYIITHWRGTQRLWISFWVNGFLLYLAVSALLVGLFEGLQIKNQIAVYAGMVLFGVVFVWQIVGITRCALNRGLDGEGIVSKGLGFLALGVMVLVVLLTFYDILHLRMLDWILE
jgi:hypothetical protein